MTLSDIQAVRLKSSDKSVITRETAKGDGQSVHFKLGHAQIIALPDLEVRVNDAIVVGGYTVDYANGIVDFDAAPAINDEIEFIYYWSIFSDDEVQYFLDSGGGNVNVATAWLLLAIAADASKVAQRQSLAGGGGLGAVTIDTSVTARELRNTAQALLEMEKDISSTDPAEGLTEPVWTEFNYQQMIEQHVIRES